MMQPKPANHAVLGKAKGRFVNMERALQGCSGDFYSVELGWSMGNIFITLVSIEANRNRKNGNPVGF